MKNVAFLAHGGANIGMGHVIRSLSLAQEFRNKDNNVIFISKYIQGINKIKESNFEVFEIQNQDTELKPQFSYGTKEQLQEDEKNIIKILDIKNIDILVIDTYNVTKDFFINLKKHAKYIVYIDDIYAFDYPVDVIINGNITGTYMGYKKAYASQKLLLGLKYNLIRSEFQNMPKREIKQDIEAIMITTGAADPRNITCKIVKAILNDDSMKHLKLNVVVGNSFNNTKDIEILAKANSNVILYRNPSKMSEIMLCSDIALSACGSTLYELSACGTPTVGFVYADNQKFIAEKMAELGYIKNIGYYNDIDYNKLISILNSMDYEYRKKVSQKQQMLLDGKGTQRIVDEILKYKI